MSVSSDSALGIFKFDLAIFNGGILGLIETMSLSILEGIIPKKPFVVADRGVQTMDAVDMLQWTRFSEEVASCVIRDTVRRGDWIARKAGDDPTAFNRQLRGPLGQVRGDQIAENYRVFVLECPNSKGGRRARMLGSVGQRAQSKEQRDISKSRKFTHPNNKQLEKKL